MKLAKNYRLKHAYEQALTIANIDHDLGHADSPHSFLGGTQVTTQEVKNGIFYAKQDGVVTDGERVALARAWARISGKVGPEGRAVFDRAAKKYKLYDPALLRAAPPPEAKPLRPGMLKGHLKEVYDDGPSGGGDLDAYVFPRGKKTYYAVEVVGEYNYNLVIGTPDGTVLHEEAEWNGDW